MANGTKKRTPRQWAAHIELNVGKISREQLIQEMVSDGYTSAEAETLITEKKSSASSRNMGMIFGGIGMAILGIILTSSSYESVRGSGGTYMVFWGLVLTGIITFFVGIGRAIQKK